MSVPPERRERKQTQRVPVGARRRVPRRIGSSRSLWDVTEPLFAELFAAVRRRHKERFCFPVDSRGRRARAAPRVKPRT
jgi:hypothetical protein